MNSIIVMVALLGASTAGAAPGEDIVVPIKVIEISDDDGGRRGAVSPEHFQEWTAFADKAFAAARIRFAFEGKKNIDGVRSTLLNNMTGVGDSTWKETKELGNRIATRYPGKLVVFIRHGPGKTPTGAGFSSHDYNFIVMPRFVAAGHCRHPHIGAFAHEVGHFLGLPHTFPGDPFKTANDAAAYLRSHGNSPAAFDGDGFSDTPPDPAVRSLECSSQKSVTLGGVRFPLPRRNLMSYYDEGDGLSPMQISRVRWVLRERLRRGMRMPVNQTSRACREFEDLDGRQAIESRPSIQAMGGYGAGSWSGNAQLFVGSGPGGSFSARVKVPRTGLYAVSLYATRAPNFGRIEAFFSGKRLGQSTDLYAPIVMPTAAIRLETIQLPAGTHTFTVSAAGKHPASTGFNFGLDCLDLSPR